MYAVHLLIGLFVLLLVSYMSSLKPLGTLAHKPHCFSKVDILGGILSLVQVPKDVVPGVGREPRAP